MVKEEASEEWRLDDVDQQDPESHMKQEETDATMFSLTTVRLKSEDEDDDEEKPLLSKLHHAEDGVLPTSSSGDQTKEEPDGEDCDLQTGEDESSSSDTEGSEDEEDKDVNNPDSQLRPLSDSGLTTEDDWREGGAFEFDVNNVNKCFSCSECGEQFVNIWSLQTHLTSHSKIPPLVKKKRVRVKKSVDPHKKAQKRLKSFSCDDCGKRFARKANVNIHMRVHTGEKPFDCDVCGQSFSQKIHLNSHKRIHTGQQPFGCDECGRRFSSKSNLNRHTAVHTGQKPLTCDFCGLGCSHKTALITHLRVHTGDKPFGCDLCEKSFSCQSYLNTHMRVHAKGKPV